MTKETDDDGNVKLSVYKQLAAGHVTISDRYLGLPFVPHIDVTMPGTSTLVKPEDIVATNASLDTTPSYNDAEKKYENLSDPGQSMSKGNTYYCYIKDDGKNREIVWSTTAIQAYQSSGEEESEENIVHTLVAKLNYRSDNLLETEVYHLSPYRGCGNADTYKVKINDTDKHKDETPDFLELKLKGDTPAEGDKEKYPNKGYIKHLVIDNNASPKNLYMKTVWDYKSIPGYDNTKKWFFDVL